MATATIPAPSSVEARSSARIALPKIFTALAAPSLFAALCFAGGILATHAVWLRTGMLFVALLAALITAALAVCKAPRMGWPAAALVYLLLGAFCAEIAPAINPQRRLAQFADHTQRVFTGEITRLGAVHSEDWSPPFSYRTIPEHSRRFVLHMNGLGAARITLYAPVEQPLPVLACGDTVRATVALHREERYLDPGVWNASEYLHEQGIGALGSARPGQITVLADGRGLRLLCRIHALQAAAGARLIAFASDPRNQRLPPFLRITPEDATMLTAMVTGNRTWLQRQTRVGFTRTGSFHLLVVSGLHLAIFSGIIFWITKQLRLSRLWATLITIALSFGYALFTGFGHPVQRSFWMVALYLIGRLLWRDRSALNAIGFAALVMLAAEPRSLFDAGLQMTLLSVLAMAGIAAPLMEKTFAPTLRAARNLKTLRADAAYPPRIAQFRISLRLLAERMQPLFGKFVAWKLTPGVVRLLLRVAELLAVSTAIELFMMMPMVAYFHRITLFALPVNVLIVPFLGVLLPCALATFVTLLIVPSLAFIPGAATAAVLHSVRFVVTTFAGFHAANMRVPMPAASTVALWIVLMTTAICAIRARRWAMPLAIATLALATAALLLPRAVAHRAGALEISVLDVGQGDSALVVTPDGKTLLINAGGLLNAQPESNFNIGEDVVSPVLWSRGVRRLDAVAITYPHQDHIGGLPAILANFHPRQIWVSPTRATRAYRGLLRRATANGVSIHRYTAGDTFTFGGVTVRVLAPQSGYQPTRRGNNNASLVLQLIYGKTSALFAGDAEKSSERAMLAEGGLRSNFLKVAHHGSATSTTPAFLAAVAPEFSAISVGQHNHYHQPRAQVLQELQNANVRTYRTDEMGMSNFFLNGTGVTASTWAGR